MQRVYEGCVKRLSASVKFQEDLWVGEDELDLGIREFMGLPEGVVLVSSCNVQLMHYHWKTGVYFGNSQQIIKDSGHDSCTLANAQLILIVLIYAGHFSLLVYCKELMEMYHYDSYHNGFNDTVYHSDFSEDIVKIFTQASLLPGYAGNICRPGFMPKQKAAWECGYAVLALIEIMFGKQPLRPISKRDMLTRFPRAFSMGTCLELRTKLLRFFTSRLRELKKQQQEEEEALPKPTTTQVSYIRNSEPESVSSCPFSPIYHPPCDDD